MTDHDAAQEEFPPLPGEPDAVNVSAEVELTPLQAPGDLTGMDRRNDLDNLPGVPTGGPVGLVDASTDATTQTANVLISETTDLSLDTFLVSPQRLVDGSVLYHYGLVTEVSGRVEGAEMATDTARLAVGTLPGQRFRRAEVSWIRTDPERYLPPSSGARVWIAEGEHRRKALFLDKMAEGEAVPIGLDMNNERVFMPYSFLNGDKGAHVSISGKSGVATKTSYALFLLYMLFETEAGRRARNGNSHDRALLFSVKGADLCLLDKQNRDFVETSQIGPKAIEEWAALGVNDPQPFSDVDVFAPSEDSAPGVTPVADIAVRDKRDTHAYGWSPMSFIENGLLEYVFDDLESGQLSFIEQVVRVQLLRWCHPLAGDSSGKVVLADPGAAVGSTWESALRSLSGKDQLGASAGVTAETLDDLVEFIAGKVTEGEAGYDTRWTGNVQASTEKAFVRRLWKATPRIRKLVRAGLHEVAFESQMSVVDVHSLHADAQRFVVASVLASVWAQHENSTAAGKTFVVLDELNKYAPRQGNSPIKSLLVDIAARGRSLGVILIGAQQNPSGVDRDITNNASLEVVGQIKASESAELGFLPPAMRARAQIIAPGTMITSQPLLPAPIPIRFPYPPYATRFAEVLESADDASDADDLLGRM